MNERALQRLADIVVARLKPQLLDTNPQFTREEAAAFCRISVREFDRERARYPQLLAPNRDAKPLLWSRDRLEIYRSQRATLKPTGS